jgi:hypothetical protein
MLRIAAAAAIFSLAPVASRKLFWQCPRDSEAGTPIARSSLAVSRAGGFRPAFPSIEV